MAYLFFLFNEKKEWWKIEMENRNDFLLSSCFIWLNYLI